MCIRDRASLGGDGDRAHLAALDQGQGGRQRRVHQVDVTASDVGQGRAAAAVADVRDGRLGGGVDQLAGQVRQRGHAGRGEAERTRLGLGLRDQFAEGLELGIGRHHRHHRHRAQHADHAEVLDLSLIHI